MACMVHTPLLFQQREEYYLLGYRDVNRIKESVVIHESPVAESFIYTKIAPPRSSAVSQLKPRYVISLKNYSKTHFICQSL